MITTIGSPLCKTLKVTWSPLPDDYPLPDDPVEDENHPRLAAALSQIVHNHPVLGNDALVVSNFALCATVDGRIRCKAPDWMYVQPVPSRAEPRRSYTPHAEGPIPTVVMEFRSRRNQGEYSMLSRGKLGKWFFYEQIIRVPTYVIFHPHQGELDVNYLDDTGRYSSATANDLGHFWIPGLDLFLGVWQGEHEGISGYWLRWWSAAGEMIPWLEEQVNQERQQLELERQQLEAERQRADRLAAQLRAMGVDPDRL